MDPQKINIYGHVEEGVNSIWLWCPYFSISPCTLFSATYLLWALPEPSPAVSFFPRVSSQWLSKPSLEPGYLGVKGSLIPCELCGRGNMLKFSCPPISLFPPSLSSWASSVGCTHCRELPPTAIHRETMTCSTSTVFTYSWLWPRIDFFFCSSTLGFKDQHLIFQFLSWDAMLICTIKSRSWIYCVRNSMFLKMIWGLIGPKWNVMPLYPTDTWGWDTVYSRFSY